MQTLSKKLLAQQSSVFHQISQTFTLWWIWGPTITTFYFPLLTGPSIAKAENANVRKIAMISRALIIRIIAVATEAFSFPFLANSSFHNLSNLSVIQSTRFRRVRQNNRYKNNTWHWCVRFGKVCVIFKPVVAYNWLLIMSFTFDTTTSQPYKRIGTSGRGTVPLATLSYEGRLVTVRRGRQLYNSGDHSE